MKKSKWFALTAQGDIVVLGEFPGFDEADAYADKNVNAIWIFDYYTAAGWYLKLREELREVFKSEPSSD